LLKRFWQIIKGLSGGQPFFLIPANGVRGTEMTRQTVEVITGYPLKSVCDVACHASVTQRKNIAMTRWLKFIV